MTKQEQIEIMYQEFLCYRFDTKPEDFSYKRMCENFYQKDYPKLPKDSIVLTKEEYEELINLQQTRSEELTNAVQSYEEDKADLKINYENHIKNLEEIIDRQNKDLNSQANRLIDLKAKLESARKETAKEILNMGRKIYEMSYYKRNAMPRLIAWIKVEYGVEIEE